MKEVYYYLTYYIFTAIDDPDLLVSQHKEFLKNKDVKCRIYIAEEGVNAVLSAKRDVAEAFMNWLKMDHRFADVWFKIHTGEEHSLPHKAVKSRNQLVGLDINVDVEETADHISPEKWAGMIEEGDQDTIMIDVRNNYESDVGHFEGALKPNLETFREFPQYARDLAKKYNPEKTRVMTYCTGGIRCELYTVLLKDLGFKEIFQLDGGVVNYGQKMGDKHWNGKLFMFDDRLAIPLDEKSKSCIVGKCHHCDKGEDVFRNCSHMTCNKLFICCRECAKVKQGCCSDACMAESHRRVYQDEIERPKPFRRLSASSV